MANRELHIGIDEFSALPQKQQITTLFQNQSDMRNEVNIRLERIEKLIKGYKLHQKLQYGWLMGLTALTFWILTKANILPAIFVYISTLI